MSVNTVGVIVGIETSKVKRYRVILASAELIRPSTYNWKFECKIVDERAIINSMTSAKLKYINAEFDGKEIKGVPASLSRFESQNHPYVIISQIVDDKDTVRGYKVAGYDGTVRNIALKDMIAYGHRINKEGKIPVQNAIFIPADEGKRAYYKPFVANQFLIEKLESSGTNKYSEVRRVNTKENNKTLSRLEEIYTKEQIEQLKLGKKQGLDIKIYANPALTAEKMRILREGLSNGCKVGLFAFPEYTENAMKAYMLDLKLGQDIRKYLSPKYSLAQIQELSLAVEYGLDISKIADPSIPAQEMSEIRQRLENEIWTDIKVKRDSSWK